MNLIQPALAGMEDAILRALFSGAMVPVILLMVVALILLAWNHGWI